MEYTKAVEAAAKALKTGEDANWELARLTFENTKAGGGTTTLEKWSADVRAKSGRKFATSTAGRYQKVWAHFSTKVEKPTWTEAWQSQYDDSNGGKRISPEKIRKDIESWKPETKQAAITKLAEDDLGTAVSAVGNVARQANKRQEKEMVAAEEATETPAERKQRKQRKRQNAVSALYMHVLQGTLSWENAAKQMGDSDPAHFTAEERTVLKEAYDRTTIALAVVEMAITDVEEVGTKGTK